MAPIPASQCGLPRCRTGRSAVVGAILITAIYRAWRGAREPGTCDSAVSICCLSCLNMASVGDEPADTCVADMPPPTDSDDDDAGVLAALLPPATDGELSSENPRHLRLEFRRESSAGVSDSRAALPCCGGGGAALPARLPPVAGLAAAWAMTEGVCGPNESRSRCCSGDRPICDARQAGAK